MTWTSAFGRACGWLLRRIVHGLALTRISPNALTFFGLVINIGAAVLFGLAGAENQARMFRWAAANIIGAGIFDMVDGRVARATGQVTQFGAFFDSVIDRYSDLALFLHRVGRRSHDWLGNGELHPSPGRIPDRLV